MADIERVRQQADRFAAALPGWADTIEQAMRRRDLDRLQRALDRLGQSARDAQLDRIDRLARDVEGRLLREVDFDAANAAIEELLALSWRAVSSGADGQE